MRPLADVTNPQASLSCSVMVSSGCSADRLLIINADDFGRSEGVNRGVLRAYREGVLTSASLMVCWPAAAGAAREAGGLALGLHVDLGEWIFGDGNWECVYRRVDLNDATETEAEVRRQLAGFQRLTRKLPMHLDSHQHVHLKLPVRTVLKEIASELGVPLRSCTPGIRYCGNFYGQSNEGESCPDAISVPALIKVIRQLPAGVTELACHPGEDPHLDSMYCTERQQEVRALCDPRVREAILEEGIQLISFADVSRLVSLQH